MADREQSTPTGDCEGNACDYQEPHRHGFACDKTCEICGGHYG